jgi:3-hydroxy-9,10-secoandrosta-1,3,5(10)-triene-9,17-dione monooxygenase reductase component
VIDPGEYRRVLGHFASAVTIVTGMDGGTPVGLTCQAFTGVSIDPPLILVCPARTSTSWPRIARTGTFAVNILDRDQDGLGLAFARSGADKFAGVGWHPAATGSPVLDGALAWIGATVTAVHDGGDHDIVVGRVEELGTLANVQTSGPLIFYRSAFDRLALAEGPPEHRARQQPRARRPVSRLIPRRNR